MTFLDKSNDQLEHAKKLIQVDEEVKHISEVDPEFYLSRIKDTSDPHSRVKHLLASLFGFAKPTHEANFIYRATGIGVCVGMFYGAFLHTRHAQEKFIRQHNASVFEGDYLGCRQRNDFIFTECASKGFKYACKAGALSASCSMAVFLPITLRNEARFTDMLASCGLVGALSRTWLGSKAMGVGALFGFVGGTVAYCAIKAIEKLSGTTLSEQRELEHKVWLAERDYNSILVAKMRQDWLEEYLRKKGPTI